MTELEKFQRVNRCETIEALIDCILDFADENGFIQGRARKFNAKRMAEWARAFYDDDEEEITPTVITREYGLRQQAVYLKYFKQ